MYSRILQGQSVHIIQYLMAIKVFIVDDHYMVIEGIRSLLQNEAEVSTGRGMHPMRLPQVLVFCNSSYPILYWDINLPDKAALIFTKEVRKNIPRYMYWPQHFNQQSFIQKMSPITGHRAMCLKNASQEELLETIETKWQAGNIPGDGWHHH